MRLFSQTIQESRRSRASSSAPRGRLGARRPAVIPRRVSPTAAPERLPRWLQPAIAAGRMPGLADPFALGDGPDACLLLHGLTGSPAEVRPIGEALAQAGLRAVGPILPGHGTTPEDLYIVTRADLLAAARSALLDLRGARRIYLCGLSAGALLAIHLAAQSWLREGLPEICAVAFLAPAIEVGRATWSFAHGLGRPPAFALLLGKR